MNPWNEPLLEDPALFPIWDKVAAGTRLGPEDGRVLLSTRDLLGVAQMADAVKQSHTGRHVTFVINQYINPTNLCVLSCKFCDFARRRGAPDAYEMTIAEVLERLDDEIKEVHITGGHHPDWPFSYYVDLVRAIHEAYPHVQIKGFTAAEIDYFERRWKIPPEESLRRFKEAGLSLLPGGGAEVFSERIHRLLYPGKAGPQRWLEIHRIAHRLGLKSNATMLYGHIETPEERLQHLLLLRETQDETGGFQNFIPLSYQPGTTRLVPHKIPATEELRMIAVARLMLDNIPHIQSYWITLGEEAAVLGLLWGADDLNGTMGEEKIMHAAGAESPVSLGRRRLIRMIRAAGRIPVERDALFHEIRVYGEDEDDLAHRSVPISKHGPVPQSRPTR